MGKIKSKSFPDDSITWKTQNFLGINMMQVNNMRDYDQIVTEPGRIPRNGRKVGVLQSSEWNGGLREMQEQEKLR